MAAGGQKPEDVVASELGEADGAFQAAFPPAVVLHQRVGERREGGDDRGVETAAVVGCGVEGLDGGVGRLLGVEPGGGGHVSAEVEGEEAEEEEGEDDDGQD